MENIEDIYALSPMQQGMLFHTLYAPTAGMYFEQTCCTLKGHLNVPAFQGAWQQVIERHAILRTAFHWEDLDEPVQVVHKQVTLPWHEQDWRELTATEQQTRLTTFLVVDRTQGFVLNQAPLVRCALLRIAEDSYYFVWSHHHLLIDGWCLPLILKEVFAFYREPSRRLPRPRPYRDYIAWLQQQDLAKAESFWTAQLHGFTTATLLPFPMPDVPTSEVRVQELHLSPESTVALQTLAQHHHLTLNTIVQGAWALLLSRYRGEEDVVFGTTVAGRPAELVGIESMIGLFINTLPVRIQVIPTAWLLDWLKPVQLQQAERAQYAYTPLIKIQGWSQVPRGTPLFDSLLVFENYPVDESLQAPLADLHIFDVKAVERTNYPLTLLVIPETTTLTIKILYDNARFADEVISRIGGHLQTLLTGIAAQPHRQLQELSGLTAEEYQQFERWNATVSVSLLKCVSDWVAEQAERTPDVLAVVYATHSLTYRELNDRADRLAHRLQMAGVVANVVVGICVERSLDMAIGVLGALKAGGAYLPLDPHYPKERLAFMLADAQVTVLLTQTPLMSELPTFQGHVIYLDRESIDEQTTPNSQSCTQLDHLAYVIYTSGSTGKPKGVAMGHLPLANLISWHLQTLGAQPVKTLQFASLSFDVSFQEMFSTWSSGGTLYLIGEDIRRDAVALLRFVQTHALTRIFLPFVALQQFAQAVEETGLIPTDLQDLITAGEQLQITPIIANLFRQLPYCKLHNHYGPSETHVVTALTLTGSVDTWATLPPIGYPIANTQIYLLDKQLHPVPIGIAGELYIGGMCLAQGYLNRPELTAEKFIDYPLSLLNKTNSEGKTVRLYKTGDSARYLSDGNLEFLGRIDQQVKIRGHRVELGEIESALVQHPAVKEAVVIAQTDAHQFKRLVAYFVQKTSNKVNINEIRDFLKEQLPDYMLPAAWVPLDSFPLTPSGKIDRRTLLARFAETAAISDVYQAPRTPIEEMIATIWADILGLPQVSVNDNFFELGGHSLLATQVISRLRNAFSMDLPVSQLFAMPTVVALAQYIETVRYRDSVGFVHEHIVPTPRTEPSPLAFAQERLWFLEQFEGDSAAYNIPMAFRLDGVLNVAALERSFNEITRRHEILRTTFTTVDGRPVQQIAPTLKITLLPFNCSKEQDFQHFVQTETNRSFDLQVLPLWRVTLLRLHETAHALLLTLHHIIADGWSLEVLVQEIIALYLAFVQDKPSPLPELPIQYADFAVWQRRWLSGTVLATQLAYWQKQLENAPPLLALPTDRPRPALQTFQGQRQRFVLAKDLMNSLQKFSQQQGTTLFMTLLATFAVLLARYSGQEDLVIGSPIANRHRKEIEPLIGCFINTLVLRVDLSGNPTVEELLQRVRRVALEAYAHQDIPFARLVEALQPERNLSHSPLFQVMLVLQNIPTKTIYLPDLTITPLVAENSTAKFDLTLGLAANEQGLHGEWEYNTDLFTADTIQRLSTHWQTLLMAAIAHPETPIAELPLLTEGERRRILVEWNATQRTFPDNLCVQQLFETQVERTPHEIAVTFADHSLTYRELNRRANQLAHHLRALGVRPEMLVGIYVERSLEMIIGLLAILKAGGAYVPLDPIYPAERLAFMLTDAQVTILLTQSHLRAQLPATTAQLVYIDTEQMSEVQNDGNLPATATLDNLAYVIYTSGSTGKPKGVQIIHRALTNFLYSLQEHPGITATDVWLAVTTLSFDIAALEIYLPLIVGARIVLVNQATAMDGPQLLATLTATKATIMQATPATWRLLLAAGWQESPDLKILCGGEALSPELANQLLVKTHSVWNMYGPTETTIWSSLYRVQSISTSNTPLPIGRPIANTEMYILDKQLQPVPIGVAGELHIGGVGLARGYLNRPELTAEKFIHLSFGEGLFRDGGGLSSRKGVRLYKTGDAARYLPDGHIEYLGRLDHQVKLRGFRIELGEIESLLNQHPQIREVVAVIREDIPDDKRLVVYFVAHATEYSLTSTDLRHFLKDKLPEYMLPSAFVQLTALPLTPNGKINRRALPVPELSTAATHFVAPRDTLELQLVHLWETTLHVQPIGIRDNFFEIGGHSLLAVQLLLQIQQQFGKHLPLATLFQGATVEQLAQVLRQQCEDSAWSSLVAIQPKGNECPFFCVPGSGGNVLYLYHLARHLGTERPFYGLQAVGLDGKSAPFTQIEDIAHHYIQAIQSVQPHGPYLLGGHSFGASVAFEMSQQLQQQGHTVDLLVIFDTAAPNTQNVSVGTDWDNAQWLMAIAQDISRLFGKTLAVSYETLRPLTAEAQLDYLNEQLKMAHIFPATVDTTPLRGFVQVYKANLQTRYIPRTALPTRIALFRASEQPPTQQAEIAREPTWGWQSYASDPVTIDVIPGDHITVMVEPQVQILGERLQFRLKSI